MKYAVLVCGEYREFDICVKSWDFLEKLDCDVYFSTWNKSIQICEGLNIHLDEDITEEKILNHLPNATVSILNETDYFPKMEKYDADQNSLKMGFHWKNALKLVREGGKEYDMIMIMRSDCYQTNPITNIDYFNNLKTDDRIYGQQFMNITGKDMYFVVDIFFIGGFKIMSEMIDKLDSTPEIRSVNIHTKLGRLFVSMGLFVDRIFNFDFVVVRPNVRNLIPSSLNVMMILQKLRDWDNKKIKN
jgi:hypothetical protein